MKKAFMREELAWYGNFFAELTKHEDDTFSYEEVQQLIQEALMEYHNGKIQLAIVVHTEEKEARKEAEKK